MAIALPAAGRAPGAWSSRKRIEIAYPIVIIIDYGRMSVPAFASKSIVSVLFLLLWAANVHIGPVGRAHVDMCRAQT